MLRQFTLTVLLFTTTSCAWGGDYFQWLLEVFPEGRYRNSVREVVSQDTQFQSRGWTCTVEQGWQSNGAWLLLEGKSLVCRKDGSPEKRLDLVCSDHDPAPRNRSRPVQHAGFYLDDSRPESTPFLRLGCQTVVQRLW